MLLKQTVRVILSQISLVMLMLAKYSERLMQQLFPHSQTSLTASFNTNNKAFLLYVLFALANVSVMGREALWMSLSYQSTYFAGHGVVTITIMKLPSMFDDCIFMFCKCLFISNGSSLGCSFNTVLWFTQFNGVNWSISIRHYKPQRSKCTQPMKVNTPQESQWTTASINIYNNNCIL